MSESGRLQLSNPDAVIKHAQFTHDGKPVRLFNLVTTAAEDWAEKNAASVRRIARSLVVPKKDVQAMSAAMEASGLVVRYLNKPENPL